MARICEREMTSPSVNVARAADKSISEESAIGSMLTAQIAEVRSRTFGELSMASSAQRRSGLVSIAELSTGSSRPSRKNRSASP